MNNFITCKIAIWLSGFEPQRQGKILLQFYFLAKYLETILFNTFLYFFFYYRGDHQQTEGEIERVWRQDGRQGSGIFIFKQVNRHTVCTFELGFYIQPFNFTIMKYKDLFRTLVSLKAYSGKLNNV